MRPERCVCCEIAVNKEMYDDIHDVWEGRLDGYCYACALHRCDAYPGECEPKAVR